GRAPPVWECDIAAGGQSGYAWNNIYRDIHSRLALWRANAAENTRLYADYRHYPGARHWREHGDFEYGEWLPAARAGRGKARGTHVCVLGQKVRPAGVGRFFLSQLH